MKTSELIGPAFDWVVARCEGVEVEYINDGITRCLLRVAPFTGVYSPSTLWAQGGPIIERERVEIRCNDYEWQAFCFGFPVSRAHSGKKTWAAGPTPLIAAMRCYCCAKLGEFIDIPEELCQQPNN